MKKRLAILFFLIFNTVHNTHGLATSTLLATSLGKFVATTGALAATYYWFTPDTSLPKLEQLNVVTLLPVGASQSQQIINTNKAAVLKALKNKTGIITINGFNYAIYSGIPQDINKQSAPVSMYSGGYSNNGNPYSYCAYTAIKCGLIQGPCVVFDYATDTRRAFNFCQEQDLHCVKLVYDELRKKAPETRVILHGACKGAMNNLRFLETEAKKTDYLSNIKAVIAESPVISVKKALGHWKNGGFLSHLLCRFALPNYKPTLKTIMQASQFPSIPTFVGSLKQDTLSQCADVVIMTQHLQKLSENDITHYTSKHTDVWHGQIGKAADYRDEVDKFLLKHGLRG